MHLAISLSLVWMQQEDELAQKDGLSALASRP